MPILVLLSLAGIYWLALGRPHLHRARDGLHIYHHSRRRGVFAATTLAGVSVASRIHQIEHLVLESVLLVLGGVVTLLLMRNVLKRIRHW